MATVTIELVSRGEPALRETLRSIKAQDYQDYEVVCLNASSQMTDSGILRSSGASEVRARPDMGLLEARYLAHAAGRGRFSLMLDSTRPLLPRALSVLTSEYPRYDMVCIREGSIGNNFWARQASLLKSQEEIEARGAIDKVSAFLLPRFFRSSVLDHAFNRIKTGIGSALFSRIGYGEHHLIFEAAREFSDNVGITSEMLINHVEDDSLSQIAMKYRRYGRSQRILRELPYPARAKRLSSHARTISPRSSALLAMASPLLVVRTLSFLAGYLQGNSDS